MCNISLTLVFLNLAPCVEESITGSLVETVEEQNIDDTLYEEVRRKIETFLIFPKMPLLLLSANFNTLHRPQVRSTATRKLPVPLLSSSENSDIMTLGDYKEDERAGEEEAAVNVEFYLGTPCSSQYTFGAAETGRSPTAPPTETEKKKKKVISLSVSSFQETLQNTDLNHCISLPVF